MADIVEREIRARLEALEEQWEKKLKLEAKIDDPNRYSNRRAGLLAEENERNKLSKEIAKLEMNLLKLSKILAVAYKRIFTTRGFTIEEIIEIIHEEYINLNTERINAKKEQRRLSPIPSTSRSVSPSFSDYKKKLLTLIPTTSTSGSISPSFPGGNKKISSTVKKAKSIPITSPSGSITPSFLGDNRKIFSTSKTVKSAKNMTSAAHTKAVIPKIKINDQTIMNVKHGRMSVVTGKYRRVNKKFEKKKKPTNS